MGNECHCCTPGAQRDRLCTQCFKVWYDSGITVAAVLAREARWRKAEGIWPWPSHSADGAVRDATVQELGALQSLPMPDLCAERGNG
jgi:hypothetical protein